MQIQSTENRGASSDAMNHHYSASNDFYEQWLDPTLTYSCAFFDHDDPGDSLEAAQLRKIDHHIHASRAEGAERVLDIGCGWGSVLRRCCQKHGVKKAVGVTLSEAQWKWSENNPVEGVEVLLGPWSEHTPEAPYDSIISIGAIEHFATPEAGFEEKVSIYRDFFLRCHELLKPGGGLSLQTVTYGNMSRANINQFICEHIFRESEIPRLSEITKGLDGLFEIEAAINDRWSYVKTLRAWQRRLKACREDVVAMVGVEKVAHYELYLRIFRTGFELGHNDLFRITMRRIDDPVTL